MLRVYRLTKERHINTPLEGGSAKRGERWNPAGVDVLYAAASPELALLEILVSLMPIPSDEIPVYQLITILLPDDQGIRVYEPSELPPDWTNPQRPPILQSFLGDWLLGTQELAVAIPSVVMKYSKNYIIHRQHPAFENVRVESIQPFDIDSRFSLPPSFFT